MVERDELEDLQKQFPKFRAFSADIEGCLQVLFLYAGDSPSRQRVLTHGLTCCAAGVRSVQGLVRLCQVPVFRANEGACVRFPAWFLVEMLVISTPHKKHLNRAQYAYLPLRFATCSLLLGCGMSGAYAAPVPEPDQSVGVHCAAGPRAYAHMCHTPAPLPWRTLCALAATLMCLHICI